MDETALVLDPLIRKCWMKRGQQKRIPAAVPRPPALSIFGGFNWCDGTVAWQMAARRNSAAFVHWLEHLMRDCYPTQQVVLIMDNASIHTSKAAQAAIALYQPRLLVLYQPPYAPELNPIERYWGHLKAQVCANRLHPNMDALCAAVVKELQGQNDLSNPARYHHDC